jgi:hypothetical protein
MLARIRSFQDKAFWGTADNARHGAKCERDFDYYIATNLVFDTAGFAGGIGALKAGLSEIPASRIVFATDYPQEIRKRETVRDFVDEIRALGADGERILCGNVGLLLKEPPPAQRKKVEARMQ